jgi:uncharacterized membrane protein YfcA
MLHTLWVWPLLFVTGLAAGWVNAITGGGGLVVLPVFLAVGVPPHLALGTNMLQVPCERQWSRLSTQCSVHCPFQEIALG